MSEQEKVLTTSQQNINRVLQGLKEFGGSDLTDADQEARESLAGKLEELLYAAGTNGAAQIEIEVTIPGVMASVEDSSSDLNNLTKALRMQLQQSGIANTGESLEYVFRLTPPNRINQTLVIDVPYGDEDRPIILGVIPEGTDEGYGYPLPLSYIKGLRLLPEAKELMTPPPPEIPQGLF